MGKTEFAVVLCFDPVAERKLKDLQETLRLHGLEPESEVSYSRPHITLAVLKEITLTELTEQLQALAEDEVCLDVELGAVGTFPGDEGVVYIAPVVTGELLGLHARFLDSLGKKVVLLRDYYEQGRWMPHCTVALYLPETQVPAAVGLCRKSEVFGFARLIEMVLIEFPSAEEVAIYALAS
jgi:2'-5' RNA ligase